MKVDIVETAKGEFGKSLANYIKAHDKTIQNAAEKIGLHPYVISKHIRMKVRPTYTSIMLYSSYLMRRPGDLAFIIDMDWKGKKWAKGDLA